MGTRSGSGGILGWEKSKSGGGGGGGGGGVDYDEDEQQEEEECDVGLGLGMQLNENTSDATPSSSSSSVFPRRKAAPAHHPQPHPYHHYLSGYYVGGGSAYGGNPTSNLLNQVSYMGLGRPHEATPIFQSPECFPSGGTSSTKTTKPLHLHHPLSTSGFPFLFFC
ncbi:hypothetical protein MLD38_027700 [Melastoma candidum]|uniref:Uncharacterized protein n=1 Tax=Melastoma candidum TaxID=119954 RepID=A0ACB9P5N8_9MYRT|nr:hypothetical protein MLD38_027700 [Melastoma candidum]